MPKKKRIWQKISQKSFFYLEFNLIFCHKFLKGEVGRLFSPYLLCFKSGFHFVQVLLWSFQIFRQFFKFFFVGLRPKILVFSGRTRTESSDSRVWISLFFVLISWILLRLHFLEKSNAVTRHNPIYQSEEDSKSDDAVILLLLVLLKSIIDLSVDKFFLKK